MISTHHPRRDLWVLSAGQSIIDDTLEQMAICPCYRRALASHTTESPDRAWNPSMRECVKGFGGPLKTTRGYVTVFRGCARVDFLGGMSVPRLPAAEKVVDASPPLTMPKITIHLGSSAAMKRDRNSSDPALWAFVRLSLLCTFG